MAQLTAGREVAAWMPAGRGWWPRPRRVRGCEATAGWQLERCVGCGDCVARLIALRNMRTGDEITTGYNPSPDLEDALWPLEVTFDGGARETEAGPVAGAGACLWRHQVLGGPPRLVAAAVVAIPWGASAQLAEAFGCRAALELLWRYGEGIGRARVVGDNLAVIRYCAGTARLRARPQQALLEDALANASARGWVLDWQAVRRNLNTLADRHATRGAVWAQECRVAGVHRLRTRYGAVGDGDDVPHG